MMAAFFLKIGDPTHVDLSTCSTPRRTSTKFTPKKLMEVLREAEPVGPYNPSKLDARPPGSRTGRMIDECRITNVQEEGAHQGGGGARVICCGCGSVVVVVGGQVFQRQSRQRMRPGLQNICKQAAVVLRVHHAYIFPEKRKRGRACCRAAGKEQDIEITGCVPSDSGNSFEITSCVRSASGNSLFGNE